MSTFKEYSYRPNTLFLLLCLSMFGAVSIILYEPTLQGDLTDWLLWGFGLMSTLLSLALLLTNFVKRNNKIEIREEYLYIPRYLLAKESRVFFKDITNIKTVLLPYGQTSVILETKKRKHEIRILSQRKSLRNCKMQGQISYLIIS